MEELTGICVSQTTELTCMKSAFNPERIRISVSPTLTRSFTVYDDYNGGLIYEVSAPELGPFGQAYMSDEDFKKQCAEICVFCGPVPCKFYNKDKHFRLSTHRGGKARAVRPELLPPDDEEEEEIS